MGSRIEHRSQLIEKLYEGVLTDDGWQDALRSISMETRSPQASLIVFDVNAQISAIGESFGMAEETLNEYNAHYHLLDAARPIAATMPLGSWYLDRRDIGEAAIDRSPFYQDFLLRHDISTVLCNRLQGDAGVNAFLSLQRSVGQPHYTQTDLARFDQIIPHVQRAVRMRTHMQRLARQSELASIVLDSLRVPLMVLDEHGRLLLANAQAESLLRRQPLLKMSQGRLNPSGLRTGRFVQLLQAACGQSGPAVGGGALIRDVHGDAALQLLVLPLPARLHSYNVWARPLALAVVQEPGQSHGEQQHLLRQIYDLTPAELRVALALCQGDTPAQAAQCVGSSVGTVRIQLKSIFDKTGARRQADLVRLLTALRIVV